MSKTENLINAIADRLETITGSGDSGVSLVGTICKHQPLPPGQCGKSHVYLRRHGDRLDSAQTQLGERDHGPIVSIDILHGAMKDGAQTTDSEIVHLTTIRLLDELSEAFGDFGWLNTVVGGSDTPDLISTEVNITLNATGEDGVGGIHIDLTFDWPFRPGVT